MRRIIAILFVFLLLMQVFGLACKIQSVRAGTEKLSESSISSNPQYSDSNTTENSQKAIEAQPTIVQSTMNESELQLLEARTGIRDEDQNYNQVVQGHGTGLAPPSEEEWKLIENDASVIDQISTSVQSPSSCDNTAAPWFPPIGDQGQEGSCVAWAVGYYTKTFQEAKEHNWNVKSGAMQNEIMSPSFIYNLINYGVDGGSYFDNAMLLVCSVGDCSLGTMPYNAGDYTSWPSELAWKEAPLYRANASSISYLMLQDDAGLANLKAWLSSGNLAIVGVDAHKIQDPSWGWSLLDGNDMLTLDNYVNPTVNHAGTIVGYNDNFAYIEQGQTHYGAFKIANSWGIPWLPSPFGWEHILDGCYWISYAAMKQRVGYCMVYSDRTGYVPTLTTSFRIQQPMRGECSIVIGVGTHDNPTVSKRFTDYIHGGNQPFCSNNIVFDITDFENAVPNIYGKPFFLSVYDGGSPATGTILYFSVENTVSSNPPISTVNGGYVFADLTLEGTIYIRADGSVEPSTAPIQHSGATYTLSSSVLSDGTGIVIEKSNIILNGAGYSIQGNYTPSGAYGSTTGLRLDYVQNVTVQNLIITKWDLGIVLNESNHCRIHGDTISEGDTGISFVVEWELGSPPSLSDLIPEYNVIDGNTITGNSHNAVAFGYIVGNTFANNIITNNTLAFSGANELNYYVNNTFTGNTIANNGGAFDLYGGRYSNAVGNNIYGNTITNNEFGIYLTGFCSDNIVASNNIYGNGGGGAIQLFAATNNKIIDNTIEGNIAGISLTSDYWIYSDLSPEYCENNEISGNVIRLNTDAGIVLTAAPNNTITNNIITNNTDGIVLIPKEWGYSEYDPPISPNSQSDNNLIFNNTVAGNSQYGIQAINSTSNLVYHNVFRENGQQAYSVNSTNVWDDGYPSGGNHWSDYTGGDSHSGVNQNQLGSDGIGDTPYVIDNKNRDHYPLIRAPCISDGFESGNFGAWTGTSITSGETASASKSIAYQGAYSAKFTSNGGGGYERAYCYLNLSSSELYARAYIYVSQTTASQNGNRLFFIVLRDAQNNGLAYAGWKRTGTTLKWCITTRQGASYVDTFSFGSPSTGRWYCLELHWKKDATNGLAEMWVDGSLVCSSNGKNTAAFGGISQVQIGLPELYGCGNSTAYCDSSKIATAYISPEPTINSFTVSPNPFSPNGDGTNDTTTIKATFNVAVIWTLQAKNSSGSLIRSWGGSSSSPSVTWDGKNSIGNKVPDGSYNLTLTGADQSGISITSKTIQIALDTKPPTVTSISVSPSSFSPKTGQTTKISYILSESCYVTIKVYNSAGTLVRTLVNNSLQTSGAKSVTWNGKTSSGTTVPAGTYTIKISVADRAGNKATPYPINKTVKVT